MSSVFTNRAFRRLVGTWTVGNLADSALFLTLGIWAKDITGSSGAGALVFLALGLPVVISPLMGALADRTRRRPLLVAGNLAAAAAATALLAVHGAGDVWIIYAVAFAYGALGSLNGAAQSGLLRDMLADEHLDSANATLSTIDQGARVFTPLVGAALYALWGGHALAVGVAVALVLTAAGYTTVRVHESEPEPSTERFWGNLVAGFRHLRATPLLARMTIVIAVAFSVIGLFDATLFELVEKGLGRPASFFGVLMSAQGAGSIIGGLTAAVVLRRLGPPRTVAVALAGFGLAGLTMAADLVAIPLLPVAMTGMALAGISIPWMFVAFNTTRQRLTPARLQGRTAAATNMSISVPQLVSIAVGAALVAVVDYRWVMICAGGFILCCSVGLFGYREPVERRDEVTVDGAGVDPV